MPRLSTTVLLPISNSLRIQLLDFEEFYQVSVSAV